DFDGINDYVGIYGTELNTLPANNNTTVSFWIKPHTLPTSEPPNPRAGLVVKINGNDHLSTWGVFLQSNGKVFTQFRTNTGLNRSVTSITNLATNNWYFVTAIWDRENELNRIF